jgi:type II secretory pathway component GspD/PulD (secretin)
MLRVFAFAVIVLQSAICVGLLAQEPTEKSATRIEAPNTELQSGEVLLQFRDQEWKTALEWLAGKLELNLDWQTLPEDKLSLSSNQELKLSEVEDLFNMQLLARGYSLLKRDGVLRLVTLKDLDITLVPRVDSEELATLPKHSIARVSFPLEWMIADEAATELKPLLSPYGKISAMASSNRLEVVDAVVNLREFHRLLQQSENDDARRERVAEFRLQHRRAEEISPKVRQLLGLPPDSSSGSSSQLDIEQARFKVEAIKQMGRDARELVSEKKPTVFLVVNDKENSLLVNAPPNKIEIVRQAVLAMDKPLADPDTAWETISRVKVYDVQGFEPDAISKLVASLQDRGSVAKETRVQYEAAYNRLVVFASPADQLTIAQLVDSFRAEKRSATVLPLANVDPSYAAKAVQLILKSPDRPAQMPGIPSDGKFQVEPDTQNNRLLLWATSAEVKDVREFLARLGETFSEQPVVSNLHVISVNGQDTQQILKRLQEIWSDISETPLIVEPLRPDLPETKIDGNTKIDAIVKTDATNFESRRITPEARLISNSSSVLTNVSQNTPAEDAKLPAIRILQNDGGNLVVASRDPVAANMVKQLLQQMLKEGGRLRAIEIKNAQANTVARQLDTMLQSSLSASSSKLVTTPAVVISVDSRTNRLLIQNASERQWRMIQEAVNVLDQFNPEEDKLTRTQGTYRFQHRRALSVLDAIKANYQDLMSMSERTLSNLSYRSSAFNKNIAATTSNPEYQGLLQLSVDKEANLLIVSAPKYLLDEVLKLAESLDKPADSQAIAIIPSFELPFSSSGDSKAADNLRKVLGRK